MSGEFPQSIRVVDSHTEGEPTRVVLSGWPAPWGATMAERRDDMKRRFDHLRRAVVLEPRAYEAVVGALLVEPVSEGAAAGVVFFNNVGYLGMCGHGTIGVVRTLAHLGRVAPGTVRLDTPAGTVSCDLSADGSVAVENVAARCHRQDVAVKVPGVGRVSGDVAYGGNWFFLTELPGTPIALSNLGRLTETTWAIRRALAAAGITGEAGAEIDHIEVSGPPSGPHADSRNFVLCPGGEYDRSPCGTGTSAKMAALHARGQLAPGALWRQESITGGLFTGWLEERGGELTPHIRGRAWITGEATLFFDATDPLRGGFAAS